MFEELKKRLKNVFVGSCCDKLPDTIENRSGHRYDKIGEITVCLVFAVIFMIGIAIYDDYGMGYDDVIERSTTLVNLKYILTRFIPNQELPVALSKLPALPTWKDRYYGVAIQLPTAIFEMLFGFRFSTATQYRIRHLWVFLQFFVSLICFYHLLCKRFGKRCYALIGVLLLWLSPRIFANSFYNIKDLPFLSWMVISVTFLVRWIRSGNDRDLCLFGVAAGVATNTRVIGGMLVLIFVALVALRVIRKQLTVREVLKIGLLSGLSYGVTWMAITPLAWSDPIGVMIETLRTFSSYPHRSSELYFGTAIRNTELPWHYLPVWIGITSPIIVLVGFVVGVGIHIRDVIRDDRDQQTRQSREMDAVAVVLGVVPVVLVMVVGATLYNGWRHFYFVYPYLVYLTVLTISRLDSLPVRVVRMAVWGIVAVSLIIVGSWMVRFHPYQMVYFNALIPKSERINFEKDYWCVSCKDAIRALLDMDENQRIVISADGMFLTYTMNAFSQAEKERLYHADWSDDYSEKDYLFIGYSIFPTTEFRFPAYETVYDLIVDGLSLERIYRRITDSYVNSDNLHVYAQYADQCALRPELTDWDRHSDWNTDNDASGFPDALLIELNVLKSVRGLTFRTVIQRHGVPETLQIATSLDGETFSPVTMTDASYSEFFFEPVEARFLRVSSGETDPEARWHVSEVQVWEEKE